MADNNESSVYGELLDLLEHCNKAMKALRRERYLNPNILTKRVYIHVRYLRWYLDIMTKFMHQIVDLEVALNDFIRQFESIQGRS